MYLQIITFRVGKNLEDRSGQAFRFIAEILECAQGFMSAQRIPNLWRNGQRTRPGLPIGGGAVPRNHRPALFCAPESIRWCRPSKSLCWDRFGGSVLPQEERMPMPFSNIFKGSMGESIACYTCLSSILEDDC